MPRRKKKVYKGVVINEDLVIKGVRLKVGEPWSTKHEPSYNHLINIGKIKAI